MSLSIGQPAPNATLLKTSGEQVALSTYWQTRPVVLTFLRHYGCQFCREFMLRLRCSYPDIIAQGAAVIAVAQGTPAQTAHFAMTFQIPFPILVDPAREAYRLYGLEEGTVRQTIGPDVLLQMLGAAGRGTVPGIADHVRGARQQDGNSLRQLGGTFIIDRGGLLRYMHIATPIYNNPTIEELLNVLAA